MDGFGRPPLFVGEVALMRPDQVAARSPMAFENVIQQQMQLRLRALSSGSPTRGCEGQEGAHETRAVREGWTGRACKLIRNSIGANARYFTDTSQKPANRCR